MNLFWEAMVSEFRAQRLDLAARAKFAEGGERITETRTLITEDTRSPADVVAETTARSGTALGQAASGGFVEVG